MFARNEKNSFFLHDIAIIVLSIFIAILLVQNNVIINFLSSTQELKLFGTFVAGFFFTSVFTTAPAIATLGEIAKGNSLLTTALLGATGAVLGDLIIFYFIRDKFSSHLVELLRHRRGGRRIGAILKLKLFRWVSFFIGGLIIASPLPDELGISLLGFSKMKMSWFIPLSFVFNFIGIVFIGLVARAL
ncbi:MAG: hypothetical protein ABI430_01625 [Candidatus Taylorbacteria bacterium]